MQKQAILTDGGYRQMDLVDVIKAYAAQRDHTYYKASRFINAFNKTTVLWAIEGIGWLVPEALLENIELRA